MSNVKEPHAPPLKKRKLASTIKSVGHPPHSLHLNASLQTQTPTKANWPPQSPSPSPPPVLRPKSIHDALDTFDASSVPDDDDHGYDSDISGILLLPDTYHHHHHDHPRDHDDDDILSDSDLDIEIVLHRTTKITTTTKERSPSPPWGRSPSPPPSKLFHKPTKKKSRWDDKNESATATATLNPMNGSLQSALIHSAINIQPKKPQKVEPLLLDEHGNPLNSHGEIPSHDTVDGDDDNASHTLGVGMADAADSDADTDEFWDDSIQVKPPQRESRRKALQFIEQGTYTRKALELRKQEHQNSTTHAQMKLNDDEGLEWLDPVPLVEWWDAPLLTDKHDYSAPLKKAMITDLIENPRILRPELLREGIVTTGGGGGGTGGGGGGASASQSSIDTANADDTSTTTTGVVASAAIPWMLTKKERKKMKRMKKKEEHQRRTDEIRLGLRDAPEPRLKLSNLYRVLGAAATRDPTAAETIARNQMWIRQMKHELHNATNQLTPAQRRDKKRRKLVEDTSKEVHVCVFVIYRLFGTLNKTKIYLNATQFNLTGALIMLNTMEENGSGDGDANGDAKKLKMMKEEGVVDMDMQDDEDEDEDDDVDLEHSDYGDTDSKKDLKFKKMGLDTDGNLSLNMVVVEGGPKGIGKYQRLLQHRIKWNNVQNNCCKIWQGTVAKRTFQKFHQIKMNTEIELKKFLKIHNVSSYWDMVKNSPSVTCI